MSVLLLPCLPSPGTSCFLACQQACPQHHFPLSLCQEAWAIATSPQQDSAPSHELIVALPLTFLRAQGESACKYPFPAHTHPALKWGGGAFLHNPPPKRVPETCSLQAPACPTHTEPGGHLTVRLSKRRVGLLPASHWGRAVPGCAACWKPNPDGMFAQSSEQMQRALLWQGYF